MQFGKFSIIITVFCFAFSHSGETQEKPVRKVDLPSAVQKAADLQSKDAKVRGYSVEVEKGQKVYEVKLEVNQHTKDVLLDSQGNLLEIEEEQAIESLPADVKASLNRAAGKGQIAKVESITKHDRLIAYEAVVRHGKSRTEVQVGPHGERLPHPE
jgi:hypothetical protein